MLALFRRALPLCTTLARTPARLPQAMDSARLGWGGVTGCDAGHGAVTPIVTPRRLISRGNGRGCDDVTLRSLAYAHTRARVYGSLFSVTSSQVKKRIDADRGNPVTVGVTEGVTGGAGVTPRGNR